MWHWEVIFRNTDGCEEELYSIEGYESMALAFGAYLEDADAITEYLKKLKCKLILKEHIVFDNDRVFKEDK